MTERESFDLDIVRQRIFANALYRCEVCGGPLMRYGTPQLAHRVPKSKANLRKYGPARVHHERNLAPVCSLKCNSAVIVHGTAEAALMASIEVDYI
jgi:hypothetical protein